MSNEPLPEPYHEMRLKELRRSLPKKQRCTAIKKDGTQCTKWAAPDYIGQKCAAHTPHLSEW